MFREMAGYFLPHPTRERDRLAQRGQVWDEPIYKSEQGNDYFLMRLGSDGQRVLLEFDARTGAEGQAFWPVPSEWDGEPRRVSVDADVWEDAHVGVARDHDVGAEHLLATIFQMVVEGDMVTVRRDGRTVARVRVRLGHLEVEPS